MLRLWRNICHRIKTHCYKNKPTACLIISLAAGKHFPLAILNLHQNCSLTKCEIENRLVAFPWWQKPTFALYKRAFPLISWDILEFWMNQYFVTSPMSQTPFLQKRWDKNLYLILLYFGVLYLILVLHSYKIKIHEINHTKPNTKVANN